MKRLKTKDLRKKPQSELILEVNKISKDLMKLNFLKQEENNSCKIHNFYIMRKNISRILTIIREKNE